MRIQHGVMTTPKLVVLMITIDLLLQWMLT